MRRPLPPQLQDKETYREVPGCPDYLAGKDGSVWSCRHGGWKQLRGHKGTRYITVTISDASGMGRTAPIHHIDALAKAGETVQQEKRNRRFDRPAPEEPA